MKTFDVSKNVMEKVVDFERKRTIGWQRRFIAIIVIAILSMVVLGVVIINILLDRQSFALLTLFGQDPEIIAAYWQDTLWVFWEEMPHRIVWLSAAVCMGIIGIFILTRRKRKILRKKLHKLEKYP
ncbi:hypothetical protein A2Z00_05100 [Candidatus Gottesmanbacteria bacterium RBG_13_45_10]|uniref:Uncharacterized protein n=1 Tax=Candidatus Gottesmanbacteria bacterium RBG_13_45_10 TaxID=1798370 RepID=A0A1F5ZGF2_9BACT|nr:MAG: hypothetical protein A2Z00_05100 [Candidatus Gottesmanbacteria bacterium RBG_13_45_10]